MILQRWITSFAVFTLAPVIMLAQGLLELPAISGNDVVLVYEGFVVNYDTTKLIPKWVAYELTAGEVAGDVPRARNYSMDLSYKGRQAMREDYSYSGWDKGHMAPAGDMKWSQTAMYESFYLTNVCPQNHDLNSRDWHILENHVRNWAAKYGCVWVVCGPFVRDNSFGTIGAQNVVVPDAFFKAILRKDEDGYKAIGFVFENSSTRQPMNNAIMSVNDIETLVGYDLFTNLNDQIEETVEAAANWNEWIQ